MRRAPFVMSAKRREFMRNNWPWAIGIVTSALYLINREPFEEIGGAVLTKIRRPLMRGTEWMELHDVDPETLALELPPDQLFGPLDFKSQMRFAIAAIKAENDLADGYVTRLVIDYFDLSLDPPVLTEKEIVDNGGFELLDLAVKDFLEKRPNQKNKFFFPDSFIRYINWISSYPTLSSKFVNEYDGIRLLLEAVKLSKESYARILVMRSLTNFAFTQKEDGAVERRILQCDGMRQIIDFYKDHTGDPVDTRFITLPLSSILRHYPNEGMQEFLEAGGLAAIVAGLNVSKFKGIPQHLRLIRDVERIQSAKKGVVPWQKQLYDADFLPVAVGILDSFPEYFEAISQLLDLLVAVQQYTTPLEMLEYRMLQSFSSVIGRYKDEPSYLETPAFGCMAKIAERIIADETCQRCLDPSVCPLDLKQYLKNVTKMMSDRKAALAAADASPTAITAAAA
jgi:hypothetical protein